VKFVVTTSWPTNRVCDGLVKLMPPGRLIAADPSPTLAIAAVDEKVTVIGPLSTETPRSSPLRDLGAARRWIPTLAPLTLGDATPLKSEEPYWVRPAAGRALLRHA
jgi:hypothetical protein